jgi:hypothetical protein
VAAQNPRTVKQFSSALHAMTIVGLVGGAWFVLEWKGREWGAPLATMAGGAAGWAVGWGATWSIRRTLSRACPSCHGKGQRANLPLEMGPPGEACPRCHGLGRIY